MGSNIIYPEFKPFQSIPRYSRDIIITEKIDGTNGQILITPEGDMFVGSRSRWLNETREGDNYGFYKWCMDNKDELMKMGPGRYIGEWWGLGIQRGYGVSEKRFSIFPGFPVKEMPACISMVPILYEGSMMISERHPFWIEWQESLKGLKLENDEIIKMGKEAIPNVMHKLKIMGSIAAPGWMKPEGIVVFHKSSKQLFKKTFDNDDKGKSYGA